MNTNNNTEFSTLIQDLSKIRNSESKYSPIIIPKKFVDMDNYLKMNKMELLFTVVDSIECGIENDLDMVEIYRFDESDYVVVVTKEEFKSNLENVMIHLLKNEKYEYCTKIKTLIDKLENPNVKEKKKKTRSPKPIKSGKNPTKRKSKNN